MPISILMPALSPTMEEGKLAKWHVKEGDAVSSGDVIAEIETDKATMEVEAVDEGVIGKLVIEEGTDGVAVNATIAFLLEEGESTEVLNDISKVLTDEKVRQSSVGDIGNGAIEELANSPDAVSDNVLTFSKSGASSAESIVTSAENGRIFASPLARRLASAKKIALNMVDCIHGM